MTYSEQELVGKHELVSVAMNGVTMLLRKAVLSDYWVYEGVNFGCEYSPLRLVKDDIVLDLGANIGAFSLSVFNRVQTVIAIEPEPRNFEILLKNIEANNASGHVIAINMAVSDKKERLHMEGTGGMAHMTPEGSDVQADILDNILHDNGCPLPTVMKVDIEGYEALALKSFSSYQNLREAIVETHSISLWSELAQFFAAQDFRVQDVSFPSIVRSIKAIARHPLSWMEIERMFSFQTSKQVLKFLTGRGDNPISSARPRSTQKLMYVSKNVAHHRTESMDK